MTGYQEILTDPSYMSQIVAFTFPHIGNVGVNVEDVEQIGGRSETAHAARSSATCRPRRPTGASEATSTWMSAAASSAWPGVDTRALTKIIREKGMPHGGHRPQPEGEVRPRGPGRQAKAWTGLVGLDLAKPASTLQPFVWDEGLWAWPDGYAEGRGPQYEVVVVDYGVKRNILRALTSIGAAITVVPADDLGRGHPGPQSGRRAAVQRPGRPGGDGRIRRARDQEAGRKRQAGVRHLPRPPDAGAGARREDGEDGSGPPRREPSGQGPDHRQGRDRVDEPRLHRRPRQPARAVAETHVSLFDGTNCGIELKGRPVFSVQHHPEASPGPTDSLYLFDRFADLMNA
jgi:carbamoyl-phosphate synthase small subunit